MSSISEQEYIMVLDQCILFLTTVNKNMSSIFMDNGVS